MDNMCSEIERRFACNEQLLLTCDTFKPDGSSFMTVERMLNVVRLYPFMEIKANESQSEVSVAKAMLETMQFRHLIVL